MQNSIFLIAALLLVPPMIGSEYGHRSSWCPAYYKTKLMRIVGGGEENQKNDITPVNNSHLSEMSKVELGKWPAAINICSSFGDLELFLPMVKEENVTVRCSVAAGNGGLSLGQARALLLAEFLSSHLRGRLLLRFERRQNGNRKLRQVEEADLLQDVHSLGIEPDIIESTEDNPWENESVTMRYMSIADRLVANGLAYVDCQACGAGPAHLQENGNRSQPQRTRDPPRPRVVGGNAFWAQMRNGSFLCSCAARRCRLRLRGDGGGGPTLLRSAGSAAEAAAAAAGRRRWQRRRQRVLSQERSN